MERDDDHHGRTPWRGIVASIDFNDGAGIGTGCRNGAGHGLDSGREAGGIEQRIVPQVLSAGIIRNCVLPLWRGNDVWRDRFHQR